MRLRHLRIRINTESGKHGTDIGFPDGLVVLWADNSMGKSTCLRSIMVALGLEAMLTTSQQDLPVPPVLKQELESLGHNVKVLESDIYVEIENHLGERIVVHRTIIGERSKDLISVTKGAALTNSAVSYQTEDYFVSRAGAATRERGFHKYLADFLGWQLPIVQTYDGNKYPLYLQCILPYIMVEQTRGWSSINPPIPTQFRIREPHKRSVEFLLDLDANKIAQRRLEIEEMESELKKRWSSLIGEMKATAKSINGVPNHFPNNPVLSWPPEILPTFLLPKDENWIPIDTTLENKKVELSKLIEEDIPKVEEIANSAESELAASQDLLKEKVNVLAQLLESLGLERNGLEQVRKRIKKINEDLQRNKDVRTLISLGSSSSINITKQLCPTCHQEIDDSLAPLAKGQSVMSIDENISFLEEQRRTFTGVLNNAESIVIARERQVARMRTEIAELRSRIRTLRQTLTSDARLPSMAAISLRIQTQEEIHRLELSFEQYNSSLAELEQLSAEWKDLQHQKTNLPKGDTSDEDHSKLEKWSILFQEQLRKFDFRSLPVETINISKDTYMPTHEGFELPTNISASDFIRVIWSYLNAMLELSRGPKISHPGLLILDEPKQQSAKDLSFAELLRRVSKALEYHQQVIFATSENRQNLKSILSEIPHHYHEFEGRVIVPLE